VSTSAERFLRKLKEAIAWANTLGVNLSHGRFADYIRAFERALEKAAEGSTDEAEDPQAIHTGLTTIEAGQELILVYEHLRHLPAVELRKRLARYIYGTTLEKDERPASGSSEPRNIGFELVFAARCASVGLPVDLPTVGDIEIASPPIDIECKRPQTPGGIEASIRKAQKQLAERAKSNARCPTGIIALSIGKLIHGGTKLLPAPTAEAAIRELGRTTADFVSEYDQIWQSLNLPCVHAVVTDLSAVVQLTDPDGLTWGSFNGINPINQNQTPESDEHLETVAQALRSAQGLIKL